MNNYAHSRIESKYEFKYELQWNKKFCHLESLMPLLPGARGPYPPSRFIKIRFFWNIM